MTAKVITFANFKGGTGKTTNASMFAYELSKKGYKVLLVDQDPQADTTKLMIKTSENVNGHPVEFSKTLMAAMRDGDLKQIVMTIKDNLDLLPSFTDFTRYPDFLEDKFPGAEQRPKRAHYFNQLLEPLKNDYDFVLIDVPPTLSIFTSGALYASDSVVITLQTQDRSLDGAENFVKELQSFIDTEGHYVDVLGVLPVILKKGGKVDEATLANATEMFGSENMFQNVVKHMERIKRWDMIGITENNKDIHDKRVHAVYSNITDEFLARLERAWWVA